MSILRLAIWVVAAMACKESSPVDETPSTRATPFAELATAHGPAVNAIAAWLRLLDRRGGLYDHRLQGRARRELGQLAKSSGRADPADRSRGAELQRTIWDLTRCPPLPTSEDSDFYCRDAIAKLRTQLASIAADARKAGTPEDKILTLDNPDPAAKKRVDDVISLVAPGPKARAWNAVKADATADPATFDAVCAAAGEEWKARADSARDLISSSDFLDGFLECKATRTAMRLVAAIAADKHCPDGVFESARDADLIPKRLAVKLAAEAKACADRYK